MKDNVPDTENDAAPPTSAGVIKATGLVFGDIGTSPIYTLGTIFLLLPITQANILGIVSLIVWTLISIVFVEYTILAMGLSRKGEGGTIVLREILIPYLKAGNQVAFVSLVSIVGISLLIGDGVITPAISILSAVEGIVLIPGLQGTGTFMLILIASLITFFLFAIQRTGTEKVAWTFGPLMAVWFVALAVSGSIAIAADLSILAAFNPLVGLEFLMRNGLAGFIILSSVFLCATGGEALYADMGHLGRRPIIRAWHLVFIALVLNYLGQGVFLLGHTQAKNVLFEMIYSQSALLYLPFLILSIAATVIASQAMISGVFSIVYQGITTRIMPLMKIEYTSTELRSQIYIDSVNWALFVAVIFMMVLFQHSYRLAAAYGLAVSGTMTVTGLFITWIYLRRREYSRMLLGAAVLVVDAIFLTSNLFKIPNGAYWSLLIAAVPLVVILIYVNGQKRLWEKMSPIDFSEFLEQFSPRYAVVSRIHGTALFFARDFRKIPQYVSRIMFGQDIIYEENVIVSIVRTDSPFGARWAYSRDIIPGLSVLEIHLGYVEIANIEDIFREAGIEERTIFYGMEEIIPSRFVWKIFATIKKLAPSIVQFYRLPTEKIHGVLTQIEL
jgi:KUP system potassium uptake protein